MNKLLTLIINWMADVFPDSCPLAFTIFGITIQPCKINPLYKQVIKEKLRRLGYEEDLCL